MKFPLLFFFFNRYLCVDAQRIFFFKKEEEGSPSVKRPSHTHLHESPLGLRTGHVNLITWPRAVWDTWGYRIRPTARRGAAAPWN